MPPKGKTAKDYQTKDLKDHILDIPDTYVGSTDLKNKIEWIFDIDNNKMIQTEMDLPEAVKRVTLEIISNAGDNSYFSKMEGVEPGPIDFSWDDDGYLLVKNGGLPVPVEPHAKSTETDLYLVATDVFSVPLTSSNYDVGKDRIGCGRNGYGSKLTNSFSKHFVVQIGDSGRIDSNGKAITGQEYIGEWKDNMKTLVRAKSSPGFKYENGEWVRTSNNEYKGPSYVQVSWQLDFARMNMKRNHYSKDELGLFARYVIEFSLTCGVPVTINGKPYDFRSIRNFASLFYSEEVMKTAVTQFCVSKDRPFPRKYENLKKDAAKEEFIINSGFIPESQILLLDTPDEGEVFSYVNGLVTAEGGTHVDRLQKELFTPIIKQFNDKNKGGVKVTAKDIKPHISMFVVCRVVNAKYNSQSKTKLENPVPNISFTDNQIKQLLSDEWNLSERLRNAIGAKLNSGLSKSDGKNVAHIKVPKNCKDANEAGRAKRGQCSLIIVEGVSATDYPKKLIEIDPDGKDFFGIYITQGKIMNVLTHDDASIGKYAKFEEIKRMLGLRQGVDYSVDSNFKTLRYGQVLMVPDADSDGMHILGLIINLFKAYWPELYARGYIRFLETPVVRVFKSKTQTLRFYDELSFEKWFKLHPNTPKKSIKYYKGLGSSDKEDVIDDKKTAPVMILDLDDKGVELIRLAFSKECADDRKTWIQNWRDIRHSIVRDPPKSILEHMPVSHIMGVSFPPYMIDNLFRSIPSVYDGLKKAQRQILFYGLYKYRYGSSYDSDEKKGDKLISFASGVVDYSKYHHGDASLYDTVKKMTRDYCGSNNLAIFRKYGAYGTRDALGKDAAHARYVGVHTPWWWSYVFDKEMISLVPQREVDGELAEPSWIPCDIPLGIINGSHGVATGWSSYIPPHHPLSTVDWILQRLEGKKRIEPLVPYFNGFQGSVEMKVRIPKSKSEPTVVADTLPSDGGDTIVNEDDVPIPDFNKGRGFITRGYFKITKEYGNSDLVDVKITEIPMSISLSDYYEFIQDEFRDKNKCKDCRDNSKTEKVDIDIIGINSNLVSLSNLKLESGHSLSNMVMLDNDGIPKCYESVESIISRYVTQMLELYAKYKTHVINRMGRDLSELAMELKIVLAYLENRLLIKDRSDSEIDTDLTRLDLDKNIFEKINLRKLSKTRVDILKKKIADLEEELKKFSAKSVESLWSDRLKAFRKEFEKRKHYEVPYDDAITVEETSNMIVDGELSYKHAHVSYYGTEE